MAIQARRLRIERDRANREQASAQAVSDFLRNDVLAQASAENQAGPDVKPCERRIRATKQPSSTPERRRRSAIIQAVVVSTAPIELLDTTASCPRASGCCPRSR